MPREIKTGLDFDDPITIQNLGIGWMANGRHGAPTQYMNDREKANHLESSDAIGKSWTYHISKRQIEYYYNDIGFREIDTDKQDIANSVAVFGCSHVFGAGNHVDETVPHFLKTYTGRPCLNYGAEGGSITTTYNNILNFLNTYDTCKGIAIMWPNTVRHTSVWRYGDTDMPYETETWQRHDLRLSEDKISFNYGGEWFTRKLNEVHPKLSKSLCLDNPHSIYLLNQYRVAVKLICRERKIPLAEISMSDMYNSSTGSIFNKANVTIPGEFKAQFDKWYSTGNFDGLSTKAKWFYINKCCARDISNYKKGDPRFWATHWGSEINRGFAKTLANNF